MTLTDFWREWAEPDSCRKRARRAARRLRAEDLDATAIVVDIGPGAKHAIVQVSVPGGRALYYDPSRLRRGIDGPWYRELPTAWSAIEALAHFETSAACSTNAE